MGREPSLPRQHRKGCQTLPFGRGSFAVVLDTGDLSREPGQVQQRRHPRSARPPWNPVPPRQRWAAGFRGDCNGAGLGGTCLLHNPQQSQLPAKRVRVSACEWLCWSPPCEDSTWGQFHVTLSRLRVCMCAKLQVCIQIHIAFPHLYIAYRQVIMKLHMCTHI